MIHKSFVILLIAAGLCSFALAQTPAPQPRAETRAFSFSFDGDGGYLGVQTAEVTKENFTQFGLRDVRGVAIEKVAAGSPAEAAGLRDGDVIVRFNGEEVTSTRKLARLVGDVAADHRATMTVLRNGADREVGVTLGKRPIPKFEEGAFAMAPGQFGRIPLPPTGVIPQMPDSPTLPPMGEMPRVQGFPDGEGNVFMFRGSGRQIGIGITPLTKQLAAHFGVIGGILVNNVREKSPAAKAGLRAGDIITEVDGKEIKGDVDLIRAIAEKKNGDVELTIARDGSRQTIRVTPEDVKSDLKNFDAPMAPGKMRFALPAPPASPEAPLPLNQILMPGRVI